jgi:two-component system phosphate regulon sensor histidine kinase PhoR
LHQFYRFFNLLLFFIILCLAAVYIYFIIYAVSQGKGMGRREVEHAFYKTLLSPRWNINRASFQEIFDNAAAGTFVQFMLEELAEAGVSEKEVSITILDPSGERILYQTQPLNSLFKARFEASIKNRNFQKSGIIEAEYVFLNRRLMAQIILLALSLLIMLLILMATTYMVNQYLKNQEQAQLATLNLISNISHELQTPVTAISLACETLRQQYPEIKLLSVIETENKRISLMTERVLQNLKYQYGGVPKGNPEPLHIHDLLAEIANNIRLTLLPANARLSLVLDSQNDVVWADKVLLSTVFYNLIENAIKYRDPEKAFHWIEVSTTSKGRLLRISVKDNGIGIPEKYLNHIFERFYRVPTNDVHNVKGHGLGLSFVKNIVEAMGGSITVRSIEGKETEFIILLNLHAENNQLSTQQNKI